MLEILSSIFSFGLDIVSLMFNLIVALMVGAIMTAKGRSGLLWGAIAFFFPWIFFFTFLIPRKTPKLDVRIRNNPAFRGLNNEIASIMALSAIVAKADGHISLEELKLVKNFVQKQFRISSLEINHYEGAFNYGKDHPEDYQLFTEHIRRSGHYNMLLSISYLFVGIGIQDGKLSPRVEQVLRQIIGGLGLNEYVYQSIKNHYMGRGQNQGAYGQQRGYQNTYASNIDMTQKYSDVLGVSIDADMSTIKKAYRNLVKANHPDNMAREGMPDEYIEYANKRISEINEAYDYLKNVKTATA